MRPNDNLTYSETSSWAIAALRDLISTKAEGRSDLLRISFRHRDPAAGAEFLNHLANTLVATQADLVQVPGADIFFQQQTKRLEREAEKAGNDLRNFSVGGLDLFCRGSALTASQASRRAWLHDCRQRAGLDRGSEWSKAGDPGSADATPARISIKNGVEHRKQPARTGSKGSENAAVTVPNFEEAPPLLLVKVYQDAMATLLKVNTDLSGSLRLEKSLVAELEKINAELASLSSKEAEYDRLKRVLVKSFRRGRSLWKPSYRRADQYGHCQEDTAVQRPGGSNGRQTNHAGISTSSTHRDFGDSRRHCIGIDICSDAGTWASTPTP